LADVLHEKNPEKRVTAMFCDAAFGAPYAERLKAMGFKNVFEVDNGNTHPPRREGEMRCENMRAYSWNRMKEWLKRGSLPATDNRLESDLCGPGFHLNKSDRLVLESKESMAKRNVASPDDGDALALTFAAAVVQPWKASQQAARRGHFAGRSSGTSSSGSPDLGWLK
jgi:phage terminase large subunit